MGRMIGFRKYTRSSPFPTQFPYLGLSIHSYHVSDTVRRMTQQQHQRLSCRNVDMSRQRVVLGV
jgi:hypothetical protein